MLSALLVVAYTGFGFSVFKSLDFINSMDACEYSKLLFIETNSMGFLCGCIVILLSGLWIKMAKGSKYWQEKYEKGIDEFCERRTAKLLGVKYSELSLKKIEVDGADTSINTDYAGKFSVSRINILIGAISPYVMIVAYILQIAFFAASLPFFPECSQCQTPVEIMLAVLIPAFFLTAAILFAISHKIGASKNP